jgi:hypothetical protein
MPGSHAPPRPGNGAPAVRSTLAQLGMELRLTARRGENLFVIVVLPLILLVFFSLVPARLRGRSWIRPSTARLARAVATPQKTKTKPSELVA